MIKKRMISDIFEVIAGVATAFLIFFKQDLLPIRFWLPMLAAIPLAIFFLTQKKWRHFAISILATSIALFLVEMWIISSL